MEPDRPSISGDSPEDNFLLEEEGIGRRLLIYVGIALIVVVVTVAVMVLPEGGFPLQVGFGSIESTLDTVLLSLAILLLVLFMIRVATWILGEEAEMPPQEVPRTTTSSDEAPISLEGRVLTIMGSPIEVPEMLLSIVVHVLQEHGRALAIAAQRMQSRSKGDDLGGANWLFAFLQIMSAHLDEANALLFSSLMGPSGSLVSSALEARKRGATGTKSKS